MVFLLTALVGAVASLHAAKPPPEQYFAAAQGLTGTTLKSQLNSIISANVTVLSYTPGVWDAHKDMYQDPANPNNIILFYSQASIPKANQDGGSGPDTYWNREHLWPNSYGIDDAPARGYTDVFHLVPAYRGVNTDRSNNYFDYAKPAVAGYQNPAHPLAPQCKENESLSWEPGDGQKGWAARAILYMTTRYTALQLVDSPPSPAPDANSSRMAQLSVMLEWNRKFLPAAKEKWVNQRIHDVYQNNRNPYIDFPEFADAVWVSGPSWGGWRVRHFTLVELLNETVSGDARDPDGDGLTNLEEMAHYSNPREADRSPSLQVEPGAAAVTLRFTRAKSLQNLNLSLQVLVSTNLVSWTPLPLTGAVVTSPSPDAETETVTLTRPLAPGQGEFYRLQVTRP